MMKTLHSIPASGLGGHSLRCPVAIVGLFLAGMVMLTGCASTSETSGAMVDQQVNFNDYETFGWYDDPVRDTANQPFTLVETAIRDAIAAEMQRKGYIEARASSPADLLISYRTASTEKVKNNPFTIGIGVGSFGSRGGASIGTSTSSVRNVTEGSLTIHAIDGARNAEVWQSDATRELGKGTGNPAAIKNIVADVFAKFPARTVTK